MQLKGNAGLTIVTSVLVCTSVSGGIVFSDDFDGPTTFYRPRQNYDSLGVHPPDVGSDPWQGNGVLRDGSDPGYPAPKAGTGGTFYGEPGLLPTSRRLDGWLTPAGGAATVNQVVRYSWDAYVQSYAGSDPFSGFEFSTFTTPGLAGGGTRGHDIWLAADGTLGYYTGSEGLVYVPASEFSFATDTWISPQLVVDYSTGAASLTIGSQTKNFSYITSGANRADQFIFTNDSTGAHLALFDNFSASVLANGTWAVSSGGDWNVGTNWTNGLAPNGVGDSAWLGGAITTPRTIYTDTAVTVSTLSFDSAPMYNISGTATLSLEAVGAPALVNVFNGSHKINLPLAFVSDTNVNIVPGSTLTLADPVVIKAGRTVTSMGGGSMLIQAPLTIEGGGTLAVGATPLGLFGAPSLVGSARINVGSQSVNVDYRGQPNPASTIEAQLTTGYADGDWTGEGIMTSASDSAKGLGWVDDMANQNVKVKRTYYGDANLSGTVDSTDFAAFVAGYGKTSGGAWANGDFNYDDKVNTLDFNMLAGNFGAAAIPSAALGSVVPEPATAALLSLGGLLSAARRRSR